MEPIMDPPGEIVGSPVKNNQRNNTFAEIQLYFLIG